MVKVSEGCILGAAGMVFESSQFAYHTTLKKKNQKKAIRAVSRQSIVPNIRRDITLLITLGCFLGLNAKCAFGGLCGEYSQVYVRKLVPCGYVPIPGNQFPPEPA
jgi:hypothetical protein